MRGPGVTRLPLLATTRISPTTVTPATGTIRNIPEEGFTGFEIPDLIDRIIIGPCDNQIILGDAFSRLLTKAGCESPEKQIHYSGIPLR